MGCKANLQRHSYSRLHKRDEKVGSRQLAQGRGKRQVRERRAALQHSSSQAASSSVVSPTALEIFGEYPTAAAVMANAATLAATGSRSGVRLMTGPSPKLMNCMGGVGSGAEWRWDRGA